MAFHPKAWDLFFVYEQDFVREARVPGLYFAILVPRTGSRLTYMCPGDMCSQLVDMTWEREVQLISMRGLEGSPLVDIKPCSVLATPAAFAWTTFAWGAPPSCPWP